MEETGNGMTKQSSSPTRSSSPQPPRPTIPRWLILDRIVHRSSRSHRAVIKDDATASALAHDCVGRPIRASLRIAAPPAISRLYLHLTGRPPIEFAEPEAIAADGHSILFRMRVPFEDPDAWSRLVFFPMDYFVYSSSSSSSPARLIRLPPCFDGGHSNPKTDKYFEPYRFHQQRTMLDEEMGILCHGGDHGEGEFSFTVADITDRYRRAVDLCLLHHPPRSAASSAIQNLQWRVMRLEVPDDMKINLCTWQNDVAVPVAGRRLCWVDYYQGLLMIDILSALTLTDSNNRNRQQDHDDQQKLMQFVPLPRQALKHRRHYIDAGEPDPFRCVSVTDAGNIKIVCILPTKQQPSPPSPSFTITAWTLHNDVEWRKDVDTRMSDTEFFGLLLGQSLPRVQPSFPTVSLVDPDVICFLLKEEDRDLFWMVEVDMRSKKLLSSALYINEEEEEDGYPAKRECRNRFFGHNFIRSEFSSFLSEDAITSLELSEKMQEAKKEIVIQNIGLEAKLKK